MEDGLGDCLGQLSVLLYQTSHSHIMDLEYLEMKTMPKFVIRKVTET